MVYEKFKIINKNHHPFDSSERPNMYILKHTGYQNFLTVLCLPLGISSPLRVFSKVLIGIVAFLRGKAINIFPYLNDFLLIAGLESALNDHLMTQSVSKSRVGQKSDLIHQDKNYFFGIPLNSTN
ncbi:hypothetical protein GDO78_008324 [Eleutherodactylus coqui]|uniref:Reverse transcriptase domain-containing protein n=1 Tax=Eleutherodactylus coqui TaxID=57060 RepID=A0A8J6FE89_ELECQ|nr:hypothetical protein GDO78_008324 [Eleutherodactylus coqui]